MHRLRPTTELMGAGFRAAAASGDSKYGRLEMTDRIDINPSGVKNAGAIIENEAGEARAGLLALFDSAQPAADGNDGFATGPALVAFANSMRSELDSTINELLSTGQLIVAAANRIESTDDATAEGISRIATSLNGLGNQPLPG